MQAVVTELGIQRGGNTIYGKLYCPPEDGVYPAVILSHGYNGTNNDWINECTFFAENGFIAIALDFCGGSINSRSTGKSTDMTVTSEKEDLLAVLDYLSIMNCVDSDRIFLLGASQGGLVSLLAASERTDKVRALALYYPALCIPDDWIQKYPNADDAPATFNFWGLNLGKEFVKDVHGIDIRKALKAYEKNVLIIHGDKDALVIISYSQEASKTLKHCELVTLPGEGHGFSPKGCEKSMNMVLDFFKKSFE